MPCKFSAPGKIACPAMPDARSMRGFCFAHEQIYLHDYAVAFRRKKRTNESGALLWAQQSGFTPEALQQAADAFGEHERPIALHIE